MSTTISPENSWYDHLSYDCTSVDDNWIERHTMINSATLSVVIVSWNGIRQLPECLAALLPQLPPDAEVIVVDNGSTGGVLLFAHRPEIVASAGIRVRRDWLALDLWAGQRAAELPTDPQPIMGASGGAALYRRALLEDIGLMEPHF